VRACVCASVCDHWTQRKVTARICLLPLDAEKSDEKKIRHRTEHRSTTVGWRAFDVQVLRAKCRGPETQVLKAKCRGPETQVLRAKCNNAGLQARADCVRPSRVPTSIK
jgi:hypothetical protein